jgi:D-alanyl-D-alanine carboxypeptidase (penicillin-binding protein 5/6)
MRILKVKRASLFLMGLTFFLFPSQNYFAKALANPQSVAVRLLEIDFPLATFYPLNETGVQPPWLSAYSVVVMDRDSAVLMYAKNEKAQLLPASTVKIMTALVVLDHYQLDQVLTVGRVSHQGQDMKLNEGEQLTVESLLDGLLIASANDAAWVLAQNYPKGQQAFIEAMNQKAKELHLNDTYFANPTGLDSDLNGRLLTDFSYSTALDLARLASWALKEPVFSQIIATPQLVVTDISGQIEHQLFNINELLGRVEGMRGVKTGWTEDAGECLVGFVEKNGRGFITVVLHSQDRFGETARLVDWVFSNFGWEKIIPAIQDQ